MSITDLDRYDLGELTAGERAWIWRRRQLSTNGRLFGRCGPTMTQAEVARDLGMSETSYRMLEQDRTVDLGPAEVALAEPTETVVPTAGELCQIARRRSAELLIDVYESFGMSRPWYIQLERAGDQRVVAFWENRGFKFP